MREIKSLSDVQIVLKELGQWKDRLSSKNQDFKGLKIQNAGDATEPQDYVTLRQLPSVVAAQPLQDQHFSIPFSIAGTVTTGQLSAPFIVGKDRIGKVTSVSVAVPSVTQSPVSQDLIVNIALNNNNILATNLVLPIGQEGPVSSSKFISPTPILSEKAKLVPIIIQADGSVAFVTIQLYITRILS